MTDKVQKILSGIATRKLCTMDEHMAFYNDAAKDDYRFLSDIEELIKDLQEEPKKCMFTKDSYTDEDRKVLCEDCKEKCEYSKKEEPVSEELEEAADNALSNVLNTHEIVNVRSCLEMFRLGAKWQKQKDSIVSDDLEKELSAYVNSKEYTNSIGTSGLLLIARHFANWQKQQDAIPVDDDLDKAAEEYAQEAYNHPVDREVGKADFILGAQWKEQKDSIPSKDLEELSSLSKRYPEVSFAKLSRIAVRVAKWQKEHLWKPAEGSDLPIFDREVIVLVQDYPDDKDHLRVAFAHRPNKYAKVWNSDLREEQVVEIERHGKGGWNIPNVKWWLDVDKLPNVEED